MKSLILQLQRLQQQSSYDPKRYFKTDATSYAAHDRFVGIRNPDLRLLAKEYRHLAEADLVTLLLSEYNEYRALALMIMVDRMRDLKAQERIVGLYMRYLDQVNNWNLVDLSAYYILGAYWYRIQTAWDGLPALIRSSNVWHRRIAVVSMLYFIRKGSLDIPLEVVRQLMGDTHDLMGKAMGWILREVGKKDESILVQFLEQYHAQMQRVTVRYAIERLPQDIARKFVRSRS